MMKIKTQQWLCIIAVMYWAPLSIAYYHSDYIHTHQKILLASNIPTRATAKVTQEKELLTDSSNSTYPFYAADSTNSQFAGKTPDFTGTARSSSEHSTSVDSYFCDNNTKGQIANYLSLLRQHNSQYRKPQG